MLTRHNANDATYFWIERVADDGTSIWSTEVSPFRVDDSLGFSGIAADDKQIVLLGGDEEQGATVMSLARDSGEKLWETTLAPAPFRSHIGRMLLLDEDRVYTIFEQPKGEDRLETVAHALSLDSGQALWSYSLQGIATTRFTPSILRPGKLVLPLPDGGCTELEGATGRVDREVPFEFFGCEIPGGLIGYSNPDVVRISPTGEPLVWRLPPDLSPSWHGPCGVVGTGDGDIIVGFRVADRVGVARLPATGGAPVWRLDLGGLMFEAGTSQNGVLPRFLPVMVSKQEGNEVVVVDLEQGSIVSRNPLALGSSVFVNAERAYVLTFFSTLFTLDPKDGSLADVTQLQGLSSRDVRPEDYRFGKLWLEGDGWATPDELPWAMVDLATGKVSLRPPVQAIDRTQSGWETAQPY